MFLERTIKCFCPRKRCDQFASRDADVAPFVQRITAKDAHRGDDVFMVKAFFPRALGAALEVSCHEEADRKAFATYATVGGPLVFKQVASKVFLFYTVIVSYFCPKGPLGMVAAAIGAGTAARAMPP